MDIMKWVLSDAGYALWKALDRPEDWVRDGPYTWIYKKRVEMWTANGGWFYSVYEHDGSLGLIERHILWQKHKRMVRRKAAGTFNAALFD